MGLDIAAYRGLMPITGKEKKDEVVTFYVEEGREHQATGLDENTRYVADETMSFRVGGYSYYNRWRDDLAVLAGFTSAQHVWDESPEGPFVNLIDFSDAEGTFGPVVSAQLALDFIAFQSKADAHPDADFRGTYGSFREAFELAAQDGAVIFC